MIFALHSREPVSAAELRPAFEKIRDKYLHTNFPLAEDASAEIHGKLTAEINRGIDAAVALFGKFKGKAHVSLAGAPDADHGSLSVVIEW